MILSRGLRVYCINIGVCDCMSRVFHRELEEEIDSSKKKKSSISICPNCYGSKWVVEKFFRVCVKCKFVKFNNVGG